MLEFVVALDLQRVNLANEVKDMIVDIQVIINHINDDCGVRFDVNIIVAVIGASLHSMKLYSFNLSDSVVPLVTILDLRQFSSEKQFNLMDNIVDYSGCIALDALIFVATSWFS
ncbi:hypothetical protein HAX54_031897, partial [Datura stramonium]|nr:hypothetical protein [Datura stramonium]